MSKKKHKNQPVIETVVETTPVEAVTTTSVEKTHNTETIDLKKWYEKVKFKDFKSVVVKCENKREFDLRTMYDSTIDFILSEFAFDDSKIYLVSRQTFLKTMCLMHQVSPNLSKKENKTENAAVSVFGDVVNMFENIFDVDDHYTKVAFVAYGVHEHEDKFIVYNSGKLLLMSKTMYEMFKAGELTADTEVVVVDVSFEALGVFQHQDAEVVVEEKEVTETTATE